MSYGTVRFPSFGRRRAFGVLGGAGAAAFLAACGGTTGSDSAAVRPATREAGVLSGGGQAQAAEQPKPGGSLTFAWNITPALDPIANTSYQTHQLAAFVYPRLYKFKTGPDPKTAQELQAIPDFAAAMPEITDGGTRYTVKLRSNVKTHAKPPLNGRVLTSEDVKVSFEKYRTEPRNANRGAFGTDANPIVTGVETPDATTVVFKLAKPFAPFINLMGSPAHYWVMPKETYIDFDPAKDMVGAGPFIFDSLQPDVAIRLRKHPDYFLPGQPYVDQFNLPIIAESTARLAQFQAERLDMMEPSHDDLKTVTTSNPKITVIKYPSRTYPFLFHQLKGSGPFKDERLRQAVMLAVDRDALLKLSWDGEGWWQNIVPVQLGKWWTDPRDPSSRPATKWFGTGDRKKDLAEAVALLKAAGYDENKKLRVKYYYTNNIYGDRYNQWSEATAGMLKETGIIDADRHSERLPQRVAEDGRRRRLSRRPAGRRYRLRAPSALCRCARLRLQPAALQEHAQPRRHCRRRTGRDDRQGRADP